jgi:hypothetical protein
MWGPPSEIHLGHTDDRTGYTGLEHKTCNTIDGAQRGNQRNGFTPAAAGANVICRACGQPYHYAARLCEMCGRHYHPSYGQQRTCSRACGTELKRRNSTFRQPQPRPRCQLCGKPCAGLRDAYCSRACAGEAHRMAWPSSKIAYYTCRYCGKLSTAKTTAQPREVCPARECQLARLAANNLRTRYGLSKEAADAQMAAMPAWRVSRQW